MFDFRAPRHLIAKFVLSFPACGHSGLTKGVEANCTKGGAEVYGRV